MLEKTAVQFHRNSFVNRKKPLSVVLFKEISEGDPELKV